MKKCYYRGASCRITGSKISLLITSEGCILLLTSVNNGEDLFKKLKQSKFHAYGITGFNKLAVNDIKSLHTVIFLYFPHTCMMSWRVTKCHNTSS